MFPILYFKNNKQDWRVWSIQVKDCTDYSEIIVSFGLEHGKKAVSTVKVLKGKNQHKRNATTHYQQAMSEAQSKYNLKLKSGYSVTKSKSDCKSIFEPMLALTFEKREKDVKYPCFVQPKLDGVRCIQHSNKLFSRKGNEFNVGSLKINVHEDIILDGELYVSSKMYPFEKFVGMIKKGNCTPQQLEHVKYYVFDVYQPDKTYQERYDWLKNNIPTVNVLKTEIVQNKKELLEKYQTYLKQGYEGIMIRNTAGTYRKNYRSPHLQKLKPFLTEEFQIVGFKDGIGQDKDAVIWECKLNQSNNTFDVRPKMTIAERQQQFKIADTFLNKWLTVQFQEYTTAGIPRFPVGLTIRDYE